MPHYFAGDRHIQLMLVIAAIGVFLSYSVLRGLHWAVGKMNGAPFHVDDVVHVLTGKYRGHIGRVYSVWEERREVRVYVSKEAERDCEDVFSINEVCRANSVDRDAWQQAHRRDD